MKIVVNRNKLESTAINTNTEIKNILRESNIPFNDHEFKVDLADKKRKSFSVSNVDDDVIFDINDEFIIDIIGISIKIFRKCAPIFSLIKSICPMIKNSIKETEENVSNTLDKWKDEYRYSVFYVNTPVSENTKVVCSHMPNEHNYELASISYGNIKFLNDIDDDRLIPEYELMRSYHNIIRDNAMAIIRTKKVSPVYNTLSFDDAINFELDVKVEDEK